MTKRDFSVFPTGSEIRRLHLIILVRLEDTEYNDSTTDVQVLRSLLRLTCDSDVTEYFYKHSKRTDLEQLNI